MFDPFLTLAALLHALLLAGGVIFVCRRLKLPWRDWPFAVYVLVWADLVLAGHMASALKGLGQLEIYVPATVFALAILLGLFNAIHRFAPEKPLLAAPQLSFAVIDNPKMRRFLAWALGLTLALAALASVVLGLSVYPDNADSMIYRLPRAFWYVSHGSFFHPFDSIDKRITFYPLNGVALYVPLVLYNLVGTAHSLPSLLSWGMVGYTAYRFARGLGAERLLALWATWLVVLTPSILAQATSTNDEILTATSLLVSLYCGWRWLVTGARSAFFLAAVAIGLSVGTKLHIVFLTPILLAALVVALWQLCKKPGLPRLWGRAIGWRTGLISLALTVVLMGSFLVYNYLSCGRFYFVDDFAKDVFNLRASLYGAFQNLLIYLSQMVLSPIADLNFWPVANDRQNFNNLLNQLFNPLIGAFIDENPSFYHMGYRFVGITLPVSVRFVEFSLWSGFIWLLWPWQARLALKQPFPLRPLFFLLAVTPPVWLLLWSFSTLYMEGTATYFTYYLVCAAPAAIFSFAPVRRALWNDLRWVAIAVVTLTSFVISTNLLMYSGFRALPDLVYARVWPYDWDLIEPNIIHEIRRADKIRIVMTHEKMPYFAFMHWHPTAQYANPFSMDMTPSEAGKFLQILPISSMVEFGFMPLKIPGKTNPGLTYLGAIRGIGREAIFALGNDVHRRWPDQSDYIVPHVTIVPTEGGRIVALDKNVPGLKDEDNLEFSYVLKQGDNVLYQRDWQREPSFSVRVLGNVELNNPLYLTLIVRSAWSNKELTRATYQVTGRGAWLPDGTEY